MILEALGLDVDTSDADVVDMINAALAADEDVTLEDLEAVADAVNKVDNNETLTADDIKALGLDVDTSDTDVVDMINAALAADEDVTLEDLESSSRCSKLPLIIRDINCR